MNRLRLLGLAVLLVLGCGGCRRRAAPSVPRPPADAAPAAGAVFVEIRGPYGALSTLGTVRGVLVHDNGQQQLADGTWSVNAHVSSAEAMDEIQSRGLTFKVLKTPEQVVRESEEMARELEAEHRARRTDASHRSRD